MTTTVLDSLTRTHEAPRYPRKIRLSDTAEAYISALAVDLLLDELQLWQLPSSLLGFWEFGFQAGAASRQAEIDHERDDADRYYYEFCRRQSRPLVDPNSPSYAELCRRRGESERAARAEAFLADRFLQAHE